MCHTVSKILITVAAVTVAVGGATMCGDDTIPFDESAGITDPYCADTPTWFEDFEVTAAYSEDDPGKIVVGIEPTNEIVDMNGLAAVEGADIDTQALVDMHTLWLVLIPYEDTDTIVIHSAVDCTTLTQNFDLTLHLSPEDNSVTYEVEYIDDSPSDAGIQEDAGV